MIELFREHLSRATAVVDESGIIGFWNRRMEQILGVIADDAIGRPFTDVLVSAMERGCTSTVSERGKLDLDELYDGVPAILPGYTCPCMIRMRGGGVTPRLVEIFPPDAHSDETNGRTLGWFDLKTGLACFSDYFLSTLGYTSERALPPVVETWSTLVHPEDLNRAAELLESLHRLGSTTAYCPVRMRTRGGKYHLLHQEFRTLHWTSGAPRVVSITEAPIRELDERVPLSGNALMTLLHAVHEAIVICQVDGTILELNDIAGAYAGIDTELARGRPIEKIFVIDNEHDGTPFTGYIARSVQHKRRYTFGYNRSLRRLHGEALPVEVTVIPFGDTTISRVIVLIRDISSVRDRERERRNTQRAETIITGARSLSDELAVDLRVTGQSLEDLAHLLENPRPDGGELPVPENAEIAVFVGQAREGLNRVNHLVAQLRRFTGDSDRFAGLMTVDETVAEVCELAVRGSVVRVQFNLQAPGVVSTCDPQLLAQVLFNIAANARDAMTDGGMLTVYTRLQDHDRLILIRMRDEGYGIPPEQLDRVVEPYFTTKPGAGGLGLSVAWSIVRSSGGFLEIDSDPGFGTTVEVYLPVLRGARDNVDEKNEIDTVLFSGVSVLILDESSYDSGALRRILESIGCDVRCVRGVTEALTEIETSGARGHRINLVIVGTNGAPATLQRLRTADPNLYALLSDSARIRVEDYARYGIQGTIPEPYTFSDVVSALRAALDSD